MWVLTLTVTELNPQPPKLSFSKNYLYLVNTCVHTHVHACVCTHTYTVVVAAPCHTKHLEAREQLGGVGPLTTWVPRIKLRPPGFVGSVFTC